MFSFFLLLVFSPPTTSRALLWTCVCVCARARGVGGGGDRSQFAVAGCCPFALCEWLMNYEIINQAANRIARHLAPLLYGGWRLFSTKAQINSFCFTGLFGKWWIEGWCPSARALSLTRTDSFEWRRAALDAGHGPSSASPPLSVRATVSPLGAHININMCSCRIDRK